MVLAAGGSSRFGSPKQLIQPEGEPLVRRAAIAAREAGANPVVVVLGANATLIAPSVSDLESVTTVLNPEWKSGLASSLATGLRTLFEIAEPDGALVTLADQPRVDAVALRRLMEAFDDEHRLVAAAYDGTIGVPAVFGGEYMAELVQLRGDLGAGPWLRARRGEVTSVPLPAASLDIDTEQDKVLLE